MVTCSPPIEGATIRWLSSPETPALVFSGGSNSIHRQKIPTRSGDSNGMLEIMQMHNSLSLTWSTQGRRSASTEHPLPLAEIMANTIEPVLIIQTVHSGKFTIDACESGAELSVDSGAALFQHTKGVNFQYLVDGSENAEITTFIVSESTLSNILGAEVADTFLEAANLSAAPSTRILRIPRKISSRLLSTFPTDFGEDMRKLLAQAQGLEYLCMLASHVMGELNARGASSREAQIQHLYEELRDWDGKPPPLTKLAERYGMSVKTMNDSFKRMFGKTIGAYMAEQRLNDAHAALQQTDIPMKVLAARSGYSHVNNFINAFRHKFGYPPGHLRKRSVSRKIA